MNKQKSESLLKSLFGSRFFNTTEKHLLSLNTNEA